ncbi:DoxX family protein [Pusillimonas sp. DMV24BSW_D]|uniref:DoxX family protein n=1 Tax=Neopusillimonas aestuarii TaxID=2716226 RepID=UPI00140E0A19|nr:DoxX family protein [Pusillimonas sp. DMV24BSW_D]QIM48553.1 DoxX family protein [Pusillimonas sp. DMV24BSW_D]
MSVTSDIQNTFSRRILQTEQRWAPLVLRVVAGVIFFAHGAQKLFGWFGGYGLTGTGQFMDSLGLSPGYAMALLAGSAEFFGGLALIIGLLVRPVSVILAVTMVVAILSVHIGNGLFMSNNGYEFALALLAMTVSLLLSGAGKLGLDGVLSRSR